MKTTKTAREEEEESTRWDHTKRWNRLTVFSRFFSFLSISSPFLSFPYLFPSVPMNSCGHENTTSSKRGRERETETSYTMRSHETMKMENVEGICETSVYECWWCFGEQENKRTKRSSGCHFLCNLLPIFSFPWISSPLLSFHCLVPTNAASKFAVTSLPKQNAEGGQKHRADVSVCPFSLSLPFPLLSFLSLPCFAFPFTFLAPSDLPTNAASKFAMTSLPKQNAEGDNKQAGTFEL